MTLRQVLFSSVAVLGLVSPALASPAQDLFDQATFLIGFSYQGPTPIASFRELRKQYQPQLDQACAGLGDKCGYDQARGVIAKIIADLKDPFTNLVSVEQLENDERYGSGFGPAEPRFGVLTRQTPKGLVVVESYVGEAAYEAGVRRGDLIAQIGGQTATLEALHKAEASKAEVALSVSRQGTAREVKLTAKTVEEAMRPRLEISGGVAILKIYHFYSGEGYSSAQRINDAVRRAERDGAKALIIDLRDAMTGYDSEALLGASTFVPKLGYTYDRRFAQTDETYSVDNGKMSSQPEGGEKQAQGELQRFSISKLPVVVLVNRYTINTAEMFAYFLQSSGRAKVVGEATAGALGVSGNAEGPLINGEYVAVSSLRMRNLDGSAFPMQVTPDVVVADDLEALLSGRDLALERALEMLK